MTRAKLEVLRLLAVEPRYTWKWTRGTLIGGRVAKQLAREGLAVGVVMSYIATLDQEIVRYEITDAGRAALAMESTP